MKIRFLILCLAFSQLITAQLKLPSFISDGMVLQQKKVNRIWGWAAAEQLVTVSFNEKKYNAIADKLGAWQVFLEPVIAGNAGDINVSAGNEKITVKNILSGEVWVCSGQSNMEWTMGGLPDDYKNELQTATNNDIRFTVVERAFSNKPQQDVKLSSPWRAISPATIGDCSAVAYWYAKKLQKQLHVPVGLIVSSWGGTPAQSWTAFEGLYDFPNYTNTFVDKVKSLQLESINEQKQILKEKFIKARDEKIGLVKEAVQPAFDDSKWEEMYLPKQWEAQGFPTLDGIVMYRVAFNISEADAGKAAVLNMPAIDDADSTYINGSFIGTTDQWDALRKYNVPAGILKAGKNSLVIKVQDDGGGGGLDAIEEKYNIIIGSKTIPLAGKAKYNVIAPMEDITGGYGAIEHQPSVLYNGMIAPLLPLSIRGVIWYQGESNADDAAGAIEYRRLFPAMINNWRNRWGQGDFPFLFVQLSSFGALKTNPDESAWALLREAQTKTLELPNTAMAVTTDIGNPINIHPHQKKEVGDRLADAAMKLVYGKDKMISAGPQFKSATIAGNQIIIQFNNVGNGLILKGNQLKHFAIAGADKKFVWADAVVKGNQVVVSSKLVQKPVAVRYAWADSPVDANLYNKEGYPAVPFRTDDW